MPVTTSLSRSLYSSYIISRSASRIRCRITCFAVCAAMRPKFSGVTSCRVICCGGTWSQSRSRSSSERSVWFFSPVSASIFSSSSIARSRASSSRRSSRSRGISIEYTRKSPSSSSSTVACREAPGVFLYAASSASSSAWISVSPSIPFSRSIVRTASMISRDISVPFVDEVAADDVLVRHLYVLVLGLDDHGAFAGIYDLAAEALLRLRAERDAAADGVAEMLRRAQRPGEARRGNVDAVLAQVVPKHVGHALAEGVVDALGMIDEHGEPVGPGELDCEHLRPRKRPSDLARDLPRQFLLLLVCSRHLFPVLCWF